MKKIILFSLLAMCCCLSYGQTKKFHHILITNDDGIKDGDRLYALAKAVSKVADRVSIIVSEFDKSGTTNKFALGKEKSVYAVTCYFVDKERNITAYTIPDNPADCVSLGLCGFFGKDRPDLVLSGINSGSNSGPDWIVSGTIGAVRTAAYLGVKAIAFSGFDWKNKDSYTVIPNWIKEFISSDFLNSMVKNSYLTVTFPETPLKQIKGIKVVKRMASFNFPSKASEIFFKKIHGSRPNIQGNKTIWISNKNNPKVNTSIKESIKESSKDTDLDYLEQGYIVITPMTVDENDNSLLKAMQKEANLIPKFDPEVKKENK